MRLLVLVFLLFPFWGKGQYINDTIRIDGSNGVKPLVKSLAAKFEQQYPGIIVLMGEGMNTRRRIQALQEEEIDIAMASHGLDIPRFTKQGLQVHWFAKMGILIGVHPSVNLKAITSDDLCQIYAGQTKDWASLGGNALPIIPLARPSDEVDTEVLLEHLNCLQGIDDRDFLSFHQKSGPLADALMKQAGAIGMTSAVRVAQSEGKIKALIIDGIKPSPKNVFSGKYPFCRNAYLITKGRPNPAVKRFLMFVNTKLAGKVLKKNAAVPAK